MFVVNRTYMKEINGILSIYCVGKQCREKKDLVVYEISAHVSMNQDL